MMLEKPSWTSHKKRGPHKILFKELFSHYYSNNYYTASSCQTLGLSTNKIISTLAEDIKMHDSQLGQHLTFFARFEW